jgi:hypothetical protein
VKIYVAAELSSGKGKDRMKLSLPPKLMVFLVSRFTPPLSANVLFCRFFFESQPVYDQTQASGPVFFLLYG